MYFFIYSSSEIELCFWLAKLAFKERFGPLCCTLRVDKIISAILTYDYVIVRIAKIDHKSWQ